jgi:hypothetical protein
MRWLGCLLVALGLGCASLPPIAPLQSPEQRHASVQACLRMFPKGYWRATHTIDASMPMGNNAVLIGVTAVEPKGIRTLLMSPEGITLFDASVSGDKVSIGRALPPLNRKGFADGLVADVRNSFLPPPGEPVEVGTLQSGAGACRWALPGDKTTDIELRGLQPIALRNYDGASLVREVTVSGDADDGWFSEVRLRTTGVGGYSMVMGLLDHEPGGEAAEEHSGEKIQDTLHRNPDGGR